MYVREDSCFYRPIDVRIFSHIWCIQSYTNVEGWRTPEVQKSKELSIVICIWLALVGRHADSKASSTLEVFGPICMGYTLEEVALKGKNTVSF